jgi:hypothetical protein
LADQKSIGSAVVLAAARSVGTGSFGSELALAPKMAAKAAPKRAAIVEGVAGGGVTPVGGGGVTPVGGGVGAGEDDALSSPPQAERVATRTDVRNSFPIMRVMF